MRIKESRKTLIKKAYELLEKLENEHIREDGEKILEEIKNKLHGKRLNKYELRIIINDLDSEIEKNLEDLKKNPLASRDELTRRLQEIKEEIETKEYDISLETDSTLKANLESDLRALNRRKKGLEEDLASQRTILEAKDKTELQSERTETSEGFTTQLTETDRQIYKAEKEKEKTYKTKVESLASDILSDDKDEDDDDDAIEEGLGVDEFLDEES